MLPLWLQKIAQKKGFAPQRKPLSHAKRLYERIGGLTLRILAVNIIAVMILGLGLLYMGQYTDSLIEGELTSLRSEAQLFAGALGEGAVRPVFQISPLPFESPQEIEAIKPELARRMVRRLGEIGKSRIRLYSVDGTVLADSHQLFSASGEAAVEMESLVPRRETLSLESLFTESAMSVLSLIPMKTKLSALPKGEMGNIYSFPDTQAALSGSVQATAWADKKQGIILTVAAPIQKSGHIMGIVLLLRNGAELERAISEVRVDVFRVFLGALGITIMLSIYLSGLITRPLQRLAHAAEAVRQGKGRLIEIPDMSHRNDEIGELSMVLRDMTYALSARMDAIERFAADVAHEIKNPLTSLRSAVETASKVKDDESREKLMGIIQHDVRRLDRLISDISNASRLDAELSRVEFGKVDLEALLLRLRDAYKKPLNRQDNIHQDDDSKILLTFPFESGSIFVRGNEDRLAQVFGNLFSNALSFSPPDAPIHVRVREEGAQMIAIEVEDQGPGIPENKLETIFERFYTERPQHEGYGNHSGLGLSISRQIVEAHGGRIWAKNLKTEDGKIYGAVLTVLLERIEG